MNAWTTVAEVAKRWGVSRMTVYRMVNDGTLRHTRIGGQIRVHQDAVQEYEERDEQAP